VREDTVLLPALRQVVFKNKSASLGEDGFESMVDRVAAIEKKLGIYDLARFTPK
jgi:hypothetical protein